MAPVMKNSLTDIASCTSARTGLPHIPSDALRSDPLLVVYFSGYPGSNVILHHVAKPPPRRQTNVPSSPAKLSLPPSGQIPSISYFQSTAGSHLTRSWQ